MLDESLSLVQSCFVMHCSQSNVIGGILASTSLTIAVYYSMPCVMLNMVFYNNLML